MARIRAIKPGFFKDSDLYDAERATGLPLRVAYAGLWTVADRMGRFKWKPREIKVDVLPYDDVDMGAVLDALAKIGKLFKYKCAGEEYGFICKFLEHQHVNKNEAPSTLPAPPENSNARAKRVHAPSKHHEELTSGVREQEQEGKGTIVVAPVALPAWMPLETWDSFLGTRKKVTPHASKLLVSKLERLKEGGDDPKAVLEQSIMNGWSGIFELKKGNANGFRRQESSHEQTERVARELIAELNARDAAGDHGRDREAGNSLPRLLPHDPGITPGMDHDAVPGFGPQVPRRAAIRG